MTTPERLRRRQLIEGVLLISIGFAMLWQTWYFNEQNDEQQQCFVNNFQALSEALDSRSELTAREAEAARRVNLAELTSKTEEEFIAELNWYKSEMETIQKGRKDNPLPPYPVGECQ